MGTPEAGTRLLKRVPILKLLEFRVVLICIFRNKKRKNEEISQQFRTVFFHKRW